MIKFWIPPYCKHNCRQINCVQILVSVFKPFQNKPWFLCVCSTSLLKTLWEKEKLLVTSNFSFSHSVFYPFLEIFCHFHQIWNCRLQSLSVWKRLKCVVWERVKRLGNIAGKIEGASYQNIILTYKCYCTALKQEKVKGLSYQNIILTYKCYCTALKQQ